MKLIDHIMREPCRVAFGRGPSASSGTVSIVALDSTRDADSVTITADDGSFVVVPGATGTTAGVLTATDKGRLDSLSTGSSGGALHHFETPAEAAAANIPSFQNAFRTAGYYVAGDGGGGLYARVASEPAHALKIQTADLSWWELVAEDGAINVHQAGAKGDGTTNDGAAFTAALAGVAQANQSGSNAAIPQVIVPPGHYYLGTTTLELKRVVHLVGSGAGMAGVKPALLRWDPNVTGVIVHRGDTIGATIETTQTGQADGSIIEGLHLVSGGGTAAGVTDGTRGHGIWLRARAVLRNLVIEKFPGNGVHIVASFSGAADVRGNANGWLVEAARITKCHQNGVYVDGADVNAGLGSLLDVGSNGRWGIWDSSFLGNTYVGCQAETNGFAGAGANASGVESAVVHYNIGGVDKRFAAVAGASATSLVSTTPGTNDSVWRPVIDAGPSSGAPTWQPGQPAGTYFAGGCYRTDSASAYNVFLNCYTENEYAQYVLPTIVIGGHRQNDAFGNYSGIGAGPTRGALYGRVDLENHRFGTPERDLTLSLNTGTDVLLRLLAEGDNAAGVGIKWVESEGAWSIFQHASSNTRTPLNVSTDLFTGTAGRSAPVGPGYPFFKRGLFLGGPAQSLNASRFQGVNSSAPTSGEWAKGDVIWNSSPAAGGTVGWVCVTAGTPGVWKTFGNIAV